MVSLGSNQVKLSILTIFPLAVTKTSFLVPSSSCFGQDSEKTFIRSKHACTIVFLRLPFLLFCFLSFGAKLFSFLSPRSNLERQRKSSLLSLVSLQEI